MFNKVFSCGFKLFESGKLNDKRTKAFCAENILHNMVLLVQKNNFTPELLK